MSKSIVSTIASHARFLSNIFGLAAIALTIFVLFPGIIAQMKSKTENALVRGVAHAAARLLRPGGWFVVEHADVQGPAVVAVLADQAGWSDLASHRDLAGRDRFASARKTEGSQ